METETAIMLALAALGVIVILAVVAYRTVRQLRRAERQAREREAASRARIVDGLQVLARCLLADQVNLTEGCLRIKVLLDNLDPALQSQASFAVFYDVYEAAKHLATHDARQALPLQERLRQDAQREQLETRYRESILNGARSLLDYRF